VGSFPVKVNVGARYVDSEVSSDGYEISNGQSVPISRGGEYQNFLPSLNMTIDISDALLGRFSMARVMSRAQPSDLSAKFNVDNINQRISAGNPDLAPVEANQADLGLEYYFANESLLAGALFYKDLRNFHAESETVDIQYDGDTYEFSQKINGKGAAIRGAEFIYQMPFTFLPSPFDGFGVNFNYSYVTSSAGKTSYGKKYELKDLSKNTYNMTVYYEKYGFDARFAYNHRSESLAAEGAENKNAIYKAPYGQLDFSTGYQITDNIKATLKVINLTNEYYYAYIENPDYNSEVSVYGRRISLGVRAKF
jgi:iron complex outermembrane recepter protein